MKYFFLTTAIVAALYCKAQVPTTPPRPIQLPVPEVKHLKKLPDLSVSVVQVAGQWNNNSIEIKVVVKIRNNSDVDAVNVMVGADVEHPALPALEHTYFHPFANTETIPRIRAHNTISRILIFRKEDVPPNPGGIYRCRIEIDPRYMIDELDEKNNRSEVFEISR